MNPNSSTTSYLSASDFLARKDYRSVAQYCSDDPAAPLSDSDGGAQVSASPNLLAAINSACGMLESAALSSRRYSVADLQALDGMSLEYMKMILSNIAMYLIMTRRPGPNPPDTVVAAYEEAMKLLDALSNGERIFAFAEAEEAGLPEVYQMTTADLYRNNVPSVRYGRAWGMRLERRKFF